MGLLEAAPKGGRIHCWSRTAGEAGRLTPSAVQQFSEDFIAGRLGLHQQDPARRTGPESSQDRRLGELQISGFGAWAIQQLQKNNVVAVGPEMYRAMLSSRMDVLLL